MTDLTSGWLAALKKMLQSTRQFVRDQPKGGNPVNDFTLAWAALKNMLRAAARDPLWAFVAIVTAPFRAAGYVARMGVLFFLVLFIVGGGLMALMQWAGIQRGDALWYVGNLGFTAFLALFVFRLVSLPMIRHFGDMDADTHGSARFATDREAAPLTRSQTGLLIGRDSKTKKLLRYDGPAHLLTMAPTRTGKGVGTIIPNLLTADRSVICIDPKGENARIAGRARQKFGPVHILDPFGVTGQTSAAFNPLDALDPDGLDVAEDASTLADALVYDDPGTAGEAHWNEEAKALIAGIILHIAASEPRSRRTLATLRENLTLAPDAFAALLKAMQASTAAGGLVARAANRHLGKSDREAAGVLSAAQRHTHFLDSPRMTAVLGRSDFRFADLKARTATVFLVLPPDRLSTYSRWLRLLVTQSLTDMARAASSSPAPVLYLLDEFAALGYLAPVERAMGLMAGYGIQLWPILQDVHQLRATYGTRAGTFLSNAGVLQVFGVNDHESARLVSDLLGQGTAVFKTMGQALDSEKSGISYGEHHSGRPLLTPDEVRNLPQNAELLFLAGQRPIVAGKLAYYADPEFRGLFDQA
jgi:type IV secretion system protein VirD4